MTNAGIELQAQVDAQLMEQGAFAPLDLLFNSGRLIYSDYEAWRRREIELLDEVLMGDRQRVLAEVESAAAYARRIGLVEQAQELVAWVAQGDAGGAGGAGAVGGGGAAGVGGVRAGAGRELRASADPKLNKLIGCRFVPAQDAPQMDLFFDNPVVALTNGIARALCARDLAESRRLLDRLYLQAATHQDLATFDQLVAGLEDLHRPVEDVAGRLAFLQSIGPAARQLLGAGSRDYLSPLWKHLADALTGHAFLTAEPNLHRSFALAQAQDWAGAAESILAENLWWTQPALCVRLADSCFRRRRRVEALTAWCQLCWTAPGQVPDAVERLRHQELTGLWQSFQDCEEDTAMGGERGDAVVQGTGAGGRSAQDSAPGGGLVPADFPAWLLLQEPWLARQLSVDLPHGNSAAEEHYRCVHRWVHAHRVQRQEEEMALRKQLQQSHPVLFEVLKRGLGKD